MEDGLRIRSLLSLQRALWERGTPDLRGVTVHVDGSPERGRIRARFLYEGSIGETQRDCVSIAEAEVTADFGEWLETRFTAVERARRVLVDGEEWVYLRWEPMPEGQRDFEEPKTS